MTAHGYYSNIYEFQDLFFLFSFSLFSPKNSRKNKYVDWYFSFFRLFGFCLHNGGIFNRLISLAFCWWKRDANSFFSDINKEKSILRMFQSFFFFLSFLILREIEWMINNKNFEGIRKEKKDNVLIFGHSVQALKEHLFLDEIYFDVRIV